MPQVDSVVAGLAALALAIITPMGLHTVSEGHVGVYYRAGALLPTVASPGFHLKIPFVTFVHEVQTTMQVDLVQNIPCGTSGGVMIYFDKIEVVNQLSRALVYETVRNYTVNYDKTWIFDKIHHEINQFCSSHSLQEVYIDRFDTLDESLVTALQTDCDRYAPGIQIIAVRVTKPRIPEAVRLK
jgi:regulator of protease activity HflC (stomatin/prohibitin superfamily)